MPARRLATGRKMTPSSGVQGDARFLDRPIQNSRSRPVFGGVEFKDRSPSKRLSHSVLPQMARSAVGAKPGCVDPVLSSLGTTPRYARSVGSACSDGRFVLTPPNSPSEQTTYPILGFLFAHRDVRELAELAVGFGPIECEAAVID